MYASAFSACLKINDTLTFSLCVPGAAYIYLFLCDDILELHNLIAPLYLMSAKALMTGHIASRKFYFDVAIYCRGCLFLCLFGLSQQSTTFSRFRILSF